MGSEMCIRDSQSGWYEITPIVEIIQAKQIAVFIIDGPPGDIGRHGILSIINTLPKEAVFIIDDLHREEELDLFQKLCQWHGGVAKIHTSAYDGGKERKWGALEPHSGGGNE